ncbi:hypothetical protein HY642_03445 [Candidatus Woesearchaeota archaeon]|nr:hypothetical protein [Candidatus Woesearchaeota archaeon]
MTIESELRALDFTDNEVKVYLTLLRIGKAMAGRIATEAGLERTSTYNALKRLLQLGVVGSMVEANRRVFAAGPPARLVDMFKEQQERAALLVPKLETLQQFEQEKENIVKFRGYAGVKTVFTDILKTCKEGEEYLILGAEGQLSERMPEFAKIYVARKDAKHLRARLLLRKGIPGRIMSKYTKARYLPHEASAPASTNIYGSKVAIILWSPIPEAVIIEDAEVAHTYRTYFEFMWQHAKK